MKFLIFFLDKLCLFLQKTKVIQESTDAETEFLFLFLFIFWDLFCNFLGDFIYLFILLILLVKLSGKEEMAN